MHFIIPKNIADSMEQVKVIREKHSDNNIIHKFVFHNENLGGSYETCTFIRDNYKIFDICLSVMAGCSMGCKICATTYSKVPFERVLNSTEMLWQICHGIKKRLNDFKDFSKLMITFMGNGEPFVVLEDIAQTIETMNTITPLPISAYNISTIGVNLNKIDTLIQVAGKVDGKIKLQYSLLSRTPSIRQSFIPNSEEQAVAIPYMDKYAETVGIPVKYNVPLIKGINDSKEELQAIAQFILEKPTLRTLKLAHFNAFPSCQYFGCHDEEIYEAADYLTSLGIKVKIFFGDRSSAIFATCGLMRASGELEQGNE